MIDYERRRESASARRKLGGRPEHKSKVECDCLRIIPDIWEDELLGKALGLELAASLGKTEC